MAHDSTDPTRGFPQYAGTGAPADAADLSEIATWAGSNIDRVVATQAALSTGFSPIYTGMLISVTAILPAVFRYSGSAWDMIGQPRFASAAARDAAITSPTVGWTILRTDTGKVQVYTAQGWVNQGVLYPSAAVITGGTVTKGDDGSLSAVFTGAGTLILTNCFAPLSATDVTEADMSWTSAAAQAVTVQQAASGVVDSASSGYDSYGTSTNQSGTVSAATALNQASWYIQNVASATWLQTDHTLEFQHMMSATLPSKIRNRASVVVTPGSNEAEILLQHSTRTKAQAWDGLKFTVSGAGTLYLKFRPRP